MFFSLFILSSRLFLSNKVISNLTLNNKISKKVEGSWYYVKCRKKQNCTDIIYTIKKQSNISDISIISNNAFTVYVLNESAKILKSLNLKYKKVPKIDKVINIQHDLKNYSNNYIVFLSKFCQIPYHATKLASNYLMFQSNEPFFKISQKLSKIGCVRLFEQLPFPRLNTKSPKNVKSESDKDQQSETNQQPETMSTFSIQDDIFSSYNNFKNEDYPDNSIQNEFNKKMIEATVFSLYSSSSHQNLLNHGINGKGQVASIVDTGLDSNLCWFVDPEREVEFGNKFPSEHRKIQSYFSYADDNDISPEGHGSFVSGLIAGSALCDLYVNDKCPGSYFNGVAPNAKLVINDVFTIKKPTINNNENKKANLENKNSNIKQLKNDNDNDNLNSNQLKSDKSKLLFLKEENRYNNLKKWRLQKKSTDTLNNENDDIDNQHKEEIEYKKKVRNERKMRNKLKRKQKIENIIPNNGENENEIIYFNPYDESNQNHIIASFPQNSSNLFLLPSEFLGATVQYHGFDFGDKSLFTSLIDKYSYENPKMLFVFPAGDHFESKKMFNNLDSSSLNSAAVNGLENVVDFSFDKAMLTTSKVSSPGDSKNVLTVGATVNDPMVSLNKFRIHSSTSPIIVVYDNVEYIGYCDEFYGISFFEYLINSLQFSTNKNNFGFNNSYSFIIGEQVFVESEKLDAFTFAQSPKFQSVDLLIVFNVNELSSKINKPIIRLPEEYQKLFEIGKTVTIKFFNDLQSFHMLNSIKANTNAKYSLENPHYFRRKPDIFMSGGPVYGPNSGSSTKNCGINGLRIGEGTSVAAAFATGEVLLIQQYIKEGFYLNEKMDTTSHMIRAILSNIAIDNNNDLSKRTPNLDKFCIFEDSYDKNEIGGIRFYSDFLYSNSFHIYKFKAEFEGDLKVTIAWNDPPHDPFSPSDVLFKVDCRIESLKTGKIHGDFYYDTLNTVKNYVIKNVMKDEEFKIFVACGDNLIFDHMNYTIVISGPFDHFDTENRFVSKIENSKKDSLKCMQKCKDNSKCVNGYCQCAKKKYGEDCSKDMIEMHNHQTLSSISLLPHDSVFMSYVFKQWKPGSKLSFTFSIKKIDQNQKTVNDDGNLNEKLFFMFSINKVPTWLNANCNSENCKWVSIEGNSLVIEYHFWNFVRNGDTLYLVAYSRENYPITFSVSSSELYT